MLYSMIFLVKKQTFNFCDFVVSDNHETNNYCRQKNNDSYIDQRTF